MLHAILEADMEADDSKECGVMNYNVITEVIAHSDNEMQIFHEIDIECERTANEKWWATGSCNPRPPSLMTLILFNDSKPIVAPQFKTP